MSRVPFLCANVTRHVRSHDRLVYRKTENTTCSWFRAPPPIRPGAKAPRQSLRPWYARAQNQKASRVRPSSPHARLCGCVLVNRSINIRTRLGNRVVSCDAARAHLHPITMACHRQLPVCIFTKLATSLASSCKSASPGSSQRLPASASRLLCIDPARVLPHPPAKACFAPK